MRWFVSQTSLQTQKSHKNLTAYGIQGSCHRLSKGFCILLVGKVQTIHLTVVSPLVKGRCGLVVFQSTYDCTVNDHLKQYKSIAIIDVQLKKLIFQYQKFCSNQNVLLWQYSKYKGHKRNATYFLFSYFNFPSEYCLNVNKQ